NRSEPQLEWGRLVAAAVRHGKVLPLRETLEQVRRILDAPVPSAVVERLRAQPVSALERFAYRLSSRKPAPFVGRILKRYIRYLQWRQSPGPGRRVGFLRYLQYGWDLERRRQIPREALSRGGRRLRLDLSASRAAALVSRMQRPGRS